MRDEYYISKQVHGNAIELAESFLPVSGITLLQ